MQVGLRGTGVTALTLSLTTPCRNFKCLFSLYFEWLLVMVIERWRGSEQARLVKTVKGIFGLATIQYVQTVGVAMG